MKLFGAEYGFSVEAKGQTLPLAKQVHGKLCLEIKSKEDLQRAVQAPPNADGVWTRVPKLEMSVHTADCMSVLIVSEDPNGPVAAVHAGWRGVMQGIIKAQLQLLDLGSQAHAILGPCLRECCFEVKDDFIEAFTRARGPIDRYLEKRDSRRLFSMVRFVVENELESLSEDHIHSENARCTYCSKPELPSFRRNGTTDPRIRAWIRR